MKILMIFATFLSFSAFASDKQNDGQMWGASDPVPFPIPYGYTKCIRVFVLPEHQEAWGGKVAIFRPPMTVQETDTLNRIWVQKIIEADHCEESNS